MWRDFEFDPHTDDIAVAMVKDIYAKKHEPRAATGTTPCSIHCGLKTKHQKPDGASPRVTFSEAIPFDNAVDKLSEAMSKMTDDQKRQQVTLDPV